MNDAGLIALVLGVPMLVTGVLAARRTLSSSLDFVLDVDAPDSWIVYSFGSVDVRKAARRARASSRRLGRNDVFAVLVRPDRFEIWGHRDTAPRWHVDRADAEVDTALVVVGRQDILSIAPLPIYRRGIYISDGVRSVSVVPSGGSIDSALRALRDRRV
ncbi:hypothetical protein J2S40_003350 [Nocardioides luteus]|uniref:Uncharacterized protein n=1 Tax=Nocardioides luteus TaxID=1844 RepID=A0ABQ5SY03_9ACTN|nr:hypothetical protein [Nocardioides luteus]MDR7312292.1 hypothetical protein [Nocardioides luteus]GGR57488.1 hypothetical protein GCM10010197_25160 [Nocardioides luteus]GLJ68538.1 hypothetical protein GCM10017579_25740 [Nocardioides luteus]